MTAHHYHNPAHSIKVKTYQSKVWSFLSPQIWPSTFSLDRQTGNEESSPPPNKKIPLTFNQRMLKLLKLLLRNWNNGFACVNQTKQIAIYVHKNASCQKQHIARSTEDSPTLRKFMWTEYLLVLHVKLCKLTKRLLPVIEFCLPFPSRDTLLKPTAQIFAWFDCLSFCRQSRGKTYKNNCQ